MTLSPPHPAPESLHPSLWRASQLARSVTRCIDTGHAVLSYQLPGRVESARPALPQRDLVPTPAPAEERAFVN